MKILYAASEATPFAKSGGLADVAGSLPKALVKDGEGVRGVVPQRLLKPEGEAQSVQVMFRPAGVYENATLCVMDGDREVLRQRKRILTPGEMAELTLKPEQIASLSGADVTVCVKQ